nr:MAG TPA: hypothetical protein [Caudoviricetes sp.]
MKGLTMKIIYSLEFILRGGCDEDWFDVIGVFESKDTAEVAKEELLKSEYYKNMTLHRSSSEVYIAKYHLNENRDDKYYLESDYYD